MGELAMLWAMMMASSEPSSLQHEALREDYDIIITNNGGKGVIPTPQRLRNQRQTRILKRRNNTHK